MPNLAKLIRLVHTTSEVRLEIDGQEFPWHVSEQGAVVGPVGRNTMPKVTVEIVAESVEVEHSIHRDD